MLSINSNMKPINTPHDIKSLARVFLAVLFICELFSLIPLFIISKRASQTGELKYVIDSMLFIKNWLLAQVMIWPVSLITTVIWEWTRSRY